MIRSYSNQMNCSIAKTKQIDIHKHEILIFESMTEGLIFLYDGVEPVNHALFCEREQFR
jgi:hypothetical protein